MLFIIIDKLESIW